MSHRRIGGDPDYLSPAGNAGKKGGTYLIEVSVRKYGIKVKGHANLDIKGRDIVCAAVSMLTQNLIISIQDLTDDEVFHVQEPGEAVIKLDLENLSEKAKTLVDSFFLGICALANEFPDNIKVM